MQQDRESFDDQPWIVFVFFNKDFIRKSAKILLAQN